MDTITVIAQTDDGKVFTSSWSHRFLADKVESYLQSRHPSVAIQQVVNTNEPPDKKPLSCLPRLVQYPSKCSV